MDDQNQQRTEREALYDNEISPLIVDLRDKCASLGFHIVIGVEIQKVDDRCHIGGACHMTKEAPIPLKAAYHSINANQIEAMMLLAGMGNRVDVSGQSDDTN